MGVTVEVLLNMVDEYFNILLRIASRYKDFLRLVCNRAPFSFNFIFSYSKNLLFSLSSVLHVSFEIFLLFRILFFYITMLTLGIFERASGDSFSIVHTLQNMPNNQSFFPKETVSHTHSPSDLYETNR
jgi:hypothetical protein